MIAWGIGFAGGVLGWTLLEYALHRWAFHRSALGRWAARGHLKHHARPEYFYALAGKVALASVVLAPIVLVSVLAMGASLGASIPLGILAGWLVYEVIHRRIHVAAPLGRYGRWARRHHLHHHFGRADRNFGVTTPLWDLVLGTSSARGVVRVPRQHAPKFPWLLDTAARDVAPRVAPAFATEYRIV
ncbi:MAG: sterol desaturase family protein [Myxococcota bacterium]|nr:sterol desaturase family protein [Myxococcota bacterium]